jgi:hypothetical protein
MVLGVDVIQGGGGGTPLFVFLGVFRLKIMFLSQKNTFLGLLVRVSRL